jgi:glucoamylase
MTNALKNSAPPFSEKEINTLAEYLLKNISTETNVFHKRADGKKISSLPGVVIAAPASQGISFVQDYIFRWARDGAIAMSVVFALYTRAVEPEEKDRLRSYLINYIKFIKICNSNPPLNGIDIRGEPKFNIDGTLWTGAWGRPQNDGAALIVIVLTQMLRVFVDENVDQSIIDMLYHPSNDSLIKSNLEYVAQHFTEPSFGAWEEVKGSHFYRSCVQRRALYMGAELANDFGDSQAGKYYIQQAKSLENFMMQHWCEDIGYYREAISESDTRGSGLDITVIMGFVYGRMFKTGDIFSVIHSRSLSTAFFIRNCFENLYEINLKLKQTTGYGPLIGRYVEDVYDGDQNLYGNPWFLTTNAFAEYYYTVADALLRAGSLELTFMSILFFKQILPEITLDEHQILNYKRNPELFDKIIAGLIESGDKMLEAVKSFSCTYADGTSLHMSEQIDRRSGQQKSAVDLTWSYASSISASFAREAVIKLWKTL